MTSITGLFFTLYDTSCDKLSHDLKMEAKFFLVFFLPAILGDKQLDYSLLT